MNYKQYLKAQIYIDAQNIKRDPMLKWFILMPVIMGMFLKLLLPVATVGLIPIGVDLSLYYDLIIGLYVVLMIPMLLGVIIGFMLLDEKDDRILMAMQVTPLSIDKYILYRVTTPMLLSYPILLLMIPAIGMTEISLLDLALVCILGAIWAPLLGLLLPLFANNKVEGFVIMKLLGGIMMIPVASFFVSQPYDLLFGIMPAYWPIKAFWLAGNEEPYLIHLVVGIIYTGSLLWLLLKLSRKKVFE